MDGTKKKTVFIVNDRFRRTCLHGYNSGVISHIIANPHFNNFFRTESASPILGAVVSVFAGGAVVGSVSSGFLLDTYGRRLYAHTRTPLSLGIPVDRPDLWPAPPVADLWCPTTARYRPAL